jgi:Zn-dependent protease with chaperone function
MNLTYLPRLLCLVLASFFLIYAAASLIILLYTPRAIRTARRLTPRIAARFLLTLRLLPAGLALIGALGLCVPSYLWFEPEGIQEQVGFACLLMALLGSAIAGLAVFRAVSAAVRSLLFARRCSASGHALTDACRSPLPLSVIDSAQPFLALTGIVHPRVVISKGIVNALSSAELAVVLSHESAHRASHDNLKRLCISLAPGFGAATGRAESGFRALERAWMRYAEYAADQEAVAGDAGQSVALASALVRVARFGQMPPLSPVAISFLGDACDLSDRVNRLLTWQPEAMTRRRESPTQTFVAVSILAAGSAVIAFNPATFRLVQSMLERLIR